MTFNFQGLLDKITLFNFGCRMARYRIPEQEHRKCLVSFYSYARQIASIREKISLTFKREEFDHEVIFNSPWIHADTWYSIYILLWSKDFKIVLNHLSFRLVLGFHQFFQLWVLELLITYFDLNKNGRFFLILYFGFLFSSLKHFSTFHNFSYYTVFYSKLHIEG